jgi:hypothetical protein
VGVNGFIGSTISNVVEEVVVDDDDVVVVVAVARRLVLLRVVLEVCGVLPPRLACIDEEGFTAKSDVVVDV